MRTTALFRAGARVTARTSAPLSTWSSVPMAPADPILGLSEAFQMDADPNKVNLGVGAYRGDDGKPYVLPSVREAEKRMLAAEHNHEYLPIVGLKSYTDLALGFAYGEDSPALTEGRVAAMQTLSGTGSLRLATEYFKRFHDGGALYVPNPTWGNHIPIAEHSGLEVRKYSYFDPSTVGLDFAGMLDDVNAAPENSIFLLHACAHNPTGIDPSSEQWAELANLMKKKNHLPFFDSAYQGFASGDAEIDASSIRHFVAEGHCIALCQSFAKNFGLYGDRIGTLSFVCDDQDETARVLSQLKGIARAMYSNPPTTGARIVETILGDAALRAQWKEECREMADRIKSMRALLTKHLVEDLGSQKEWGHICDQIGMFCFSGLTPEQVAKMVGEHHVYMTSNGRISMAGVTSENAQYIAAAIHAVTK